MWWVLFLYFISAHANTCVPGTRKDSDGICTQCLAGYAQSEPNQESCTKCLGGQFSPDKGYAVCSNCPSGFFSKYDTINTNCVGCQPGTFQDIAGSDYCLVCDTGFFSDANAAYCTGCSPGRYSDEYSASTCFDCHIGRYTDNIDNVDCITCPNGQYTITTGQRSCKFCNISTDCRYCAGFGGEPGNCVACEEGQYSSTSMENCSDCGWGTISFDGYIELENIHDAQPNSNGYGSCSPCSRGEYFEPTNLTCMECGLGTTTFNFSCVDCSPGQFRDRPIDIDMLDNETCAVCPTGFKGENPIRCTACTAGRYQAQTNQTTCDGCDSPKKSMPGASICSRDACLVGETTDGVCIICAAGEEVVGNGCIQCQNNFIKPYTYGACLKCSAGLISNNGNTACEFCPTGKYENDICTDCPAGTYMPLDSPTPPVSCSSCPGLRLGKK